MGWGLNDPVPRGVRTEVTEVAPAEAELTAQAELTEEDRLLFGGDGKYDRRTTGKRKKEAEVDASRASETGDRRASQASKRCKGSREREVRSGQHLTDGGRQSRVIGNQPPQSHRSQVLSGQHQRGGGGRRPVKPSLDGELPPRSKVHSSGPKSRQSGTKVHSSGPMSRQSGRGGKPVGQNGHEGPLCEVKKAKLLQAP